MRPDLSVFAKSINFTSMSSSSIAALNSATSNVVSSYDPNSIFLGANSKTFSTSMTGNETAKPFSFDISGSSGNGLGAITSSIVNKAGNAMSNIKIASSTRSSSGASSSYYSSSASNVPDNKIPTNEFKFSENMTSQQQNDIAAFKRNYEQNKDKYKAVSEKTGVPAELIAALHWRESTGNFGTYMHNGDPLGKPTVNVPKGKLFHTWEESAIDAVSSSYGTVDKNNLSSYYEYAERYNGLGYRNKGVASPYVWSGTSNYSCGKYVRDGVYDPNTKDKQLGVAVMLKSIMT